jgi:hypothetical protein
LPIGVGDRPAELYGLDAIALGEEADGVVLLKS